MLGHDVRCNSTVEVWSILEQLFSTQSKSSILQLHLLLQTTKKDSTPIDEYILKMKALFDALMAADQNITDKELILYILRGLGAEYESIIVNLISMESSTLQRFSSCYKTMKCCWSNFMLLLNADLQLSNAYVNFASSKKCNGNDSNSNSNGYKE